MKHVAVFCSIILIGIILISAFAPLIAPYDPNAVDMTQRLEPPSREHPLGTDGVGRDLLSRTIYGGRASIVLALAATFCSMMVGLIIGLVAGYFGGVADWLVTTLSSVFQGIPDLCFMVALAGILEPGTHSILISVTITSWVGFSRIVRSEVMRLKGESYIESARGIGASHLRILFSDILPNIMGDILVLFTNRLGSVILSTAALSFLNLGIQPPTPDWGVMINDARSTFRSAPRLAIAPGFCIFALSFSVNFIGDFLRDSLDVRKNNASQS